MKKIFCFILALCLIMTAGCGGKKGESDTSPNSSSAFKGSIKVPDEIPISFILAPTQNTSWNTKLTLNKDGTFSGEYHETLVDQTDDGEFTLISLCNFEGYFKAIEKIDDFTYRLTIGEYKTELGLGDEWVENGIFYQSAEPFGISDCQEFMLYLPGKITGALPDNFLMWVNHKIYNGKLQTYALHNTANGFGFVEAD